MSSFVVKQPSSNSNTWALVLALIALAVVCQMRRTPGFLASQQSAPRTEAQRVEARRANLGAAVSGAIGIDESRGDSVTVIESQPAP